MAVEDNDKAIEELMQERFLELVDLGLQKGIYESEGDSIKLSQPVGYNFLNSCLLDLFFQHCEQLQYVNNEENYIEFAKKTLEELDVNQTLNLTLIGLHQLKYGEKQIDESTGEETKQ